MDPAYCWIGLYHAPEGSIGKLLARFGEARAFWPYPWSTSLSRASIWFRRAAYPKRTGWGRLCSSRLTGMAPPPDVGLLNPLLAAIIHVVSELAFILNSTRLLPGNSRAGS